MKENVDMEFRQRKLEKHVNVYMIFLALIGLICMIVCSGILFLMRKKQNEPTANDVFQYNIHSVVEVKAYTDDVGESFGTAEFIGDDGTLVTNAHVITYKSLGETIAFENISIRFCYEDDYRSVTLVKYDSKLDIAVLKLNNLNCNFKPMKLGDSSRLNNGDRIYAIGNLNNIGISITEGIVSNSNITVTNNDVTRDVIQCDLTIAEGNSGGALVDVKGRLIGITTFRLKDNSGNVIYGISYCIPINTVLEYIKT